MDWVVYQIIACILVGVINAGFRYYGINLKTWLCAIGVASLSQFCFGKSFTMAPSIFQPWVLGNLVLGLVGLLFSVLIFDGVLAFRHYIGLALALLAGFLLIG